MPSTWQKIFLKKCNSLASHIGTKAEVEKLDDILEKDLGQLVIFLARKIFKFKMFYAGLNYTSRVLSPDQMLEELQNWYCFNGAQREVRIDGIACLPIICCGVDIFVLKNAREL